MTNVVLVLLVAAAQFTDVTDESGLDFRHDSGAEGGYLLPEITGSGVAFVDVDSDGDLDLYFVQAGSGTDRLFQQQSPGRFVDVSGSSGIEDDDYGMGVAAGDIDNDGHVDLFVTNDGPDRLYRNTGGGTFEDVTAARGITGDHWSASAVFCDFDADGFLDLYVTHYVDYDPDKSCTQSDGSKDYCSPQVFPGTPDTLYRNDSGRRFVDVSDRAGILGARAPGLGVLCADFNGDGHLDFYVANDGEANQLWQGAGDGTFVDEALLLGVALDDRGQPEAGMGITAGDVDADGDLDLFMTHIINQTNTLYVNDGELGYEDRSTASGIAGSSLALTGFGTGFADFDHDGDLDLAIANGRVQRHPPLDGASMTPYWNAYAEPNQLLDNDGGRFVDISAHSGDLGMPIEVSRGMAFGDIDLDGDVDVVIMNTATGARLYRNDVDKSGDWLSVRALEGKRDAHGARVTVVMPEGAITRLATPGYGYLSSHDPRAHFGLPKGTKVDRIEIVWPDGSIESFPGSAVNQAIELVRGTGS